MKHFLRCLYLVKLVAPRKGVELLHHSPPRKGNKVSSAFSTQSVLSLPPVVYVRLAVHLPPVKHIYCWYRLTASVRARLKAVSGCALRNPVRTKLAGSVHTHDTNTFRPNQSTKWIGSSFDAYLDAFFGALIRSLIRFAFPLVAKLGNLATPLRGSWTPKLMQSVYIA